MKYKYKFFFYNLIFFLLIGIFPLSPLYAEDKFSPLVERIAGKDRYFTAIELSKKYFSKSDVVILARGDIFPDALAGASLSGKYKAPLLLTHSQYLCAVTKSEISRLGAKKVYLLGTEDALSKQIEIELNEKLSIEKENIIRLGGETRYETALEICKKVDPLPKKTVIITTGENYPDALCAGPLSAYKKIPIILVKKEEIPISVQNFLKEEAGKVIIIGGEKVVAKSIENWLKDNGITVLTRISGEDRYQTSQFVANYALKEGLSQNSIYLATGENFPDALSIGAIAGQKNSILLLVKNSEIPSPVQAFLEDEEMKIENIFIAGEEDVVSKEIELMLRQFNFMPYPTEVTGTSNFGEVSITWKKSDFSDLGGYNIYRRKTNENYLKIGETKLEEYLDTEVEIGRSYFYAVSLFDLRGKESQKSNEIEIKPQLNINKELNAYPISFIEFLSTPVIFDKNGIPLYDYGGNIGLQYSPIYISQYGLANFNVYLKNKENKYLQNFIKQARWLVENQKRKEKMGIWPFYFDNEDYGAKAPWLSAMAQAQAISVLLRAYQIEQDLDYFYAARSALICFDYQIKDGGVSYIEDGYTFYEEVAVEPPPHILNGHIFSLWGAYDYYQVIKNPKALRIYDKGIETLEKNLYRYDVGDGRSKYDLKFWPNKNPPINIAEESYHNLHTQMLKILYEQTKKDIFNDYYKKWKK